MDLSKKLWFVERKICRKTCDYFLDYFSSLAINSNLLTSTTFQLLFINLYNFSINFPNSIIWSIKNFVIFTKKKEVKLKKIKTHFFNFLSVFSAFYRSSILVSRNFNSIWLWMYKLYFHIEIISRGLMLV